MWFKDISIFSSDHFIQCSRTVCAIMIEGIMGNIYVIILNLGQWFRGCRLRIFLFLAPAAILLSGPGIILHNGEHSCEIILIGLVVQNGNQG